MRFYDVKDFTDAAQRVLVAADVKTTKKAKGE